MTTIDYTVKNFLVLIQLNSLRPDGEYHNHIPGNMKEKEQEDKANGA